MKQLFIFLHIKWLWMRPNSWCRGKLAGFEPPAFIRLKLHFSSWEIIGSVKYISWLQASSLHMVKIAFLIMRNNRKCEVIGSLRPESKTYVKGVIESAKSLLVSS